MRGFAAPTIHSGVQHGIAAEISPFLLTGCKQHAIRNVRSDSALLNVV